MLSALLGRKRSDKTTEGNESTQSPGGCQGRFCLRDFQPGKKKKITHNKNLSAFTQISLEKTKGSLMKFH